jgi:hypothetical protein
MNILSNGGVAASSALQHTQNTQLSTKTPIYYY